MVAFRHQETTSLIQNFWSIRAKVAITSQQKIFRFWILVFKIQDLVSSLVPNLLTKPGFRSLTITMGYGQLYSPI